jgi:hypothetical protein
MYNNYEFAIAEVEICGLVVGLANVKFKEAGAVSE